MVDVQRNGRHYNAGRLALAMPALRRGRLHLRPSVLVTRRLFAEAEATLRLSFHMARPPRQAEGILARLAERVEERLFDRTPLLRVVSQCAAGPGSLEIQEIRVSARRLRRAPA